ncbi:phage terminase small subunit [Pseudoxanthomonas sp. PXM02]|uniref:phage terminase small subunit n=1 Tax=Pseudoxanthomonas sp. PXM02 TaxID=2769294 RepID=UPI001785E496|nr:phage terminase small subunit [Pseudoxanthomonas sp. PXM02]MBD9478509.1 terminase [Pseudoxanthomonas sp. PXM02]
MAQSPAKRHLTRVLAAQEASKAANGALRAGGTVFEQHMMLLQEHRLRLKQIQSAEAKATYKAGALHEFSDYLDGVLKADAGGDDEVVTTVMLWAIDAGLYAAALGVAEYVLRHKLAMPDRFSRTTGCVIAEEIAEAALAAHATGKTFEAGVLGMALRMTADQDMPDEVRAKLHLAMGRDVLRSCTDEAPASIFELEECVASLKRAIELHGSCGGKKDLERAERLLKKQTAAADTAAAKSDNPEGDAKADSADAAKGASDNAGG